uniref:Zinc finger and AT-hook domain containing n=1 Tax=Monodelphis domestica TaxID=13616 RepID=A0A5F8GG76_MONDO
METQAADHHSIFMCKFCNLFSPSQSELLSHASEKHKEEGVNINEIIIPLRPLTTTEPSNQNKSGEELLVVKRKRGRPKGSTKKLCPDEESTENNNRSPNEENQLALPEGNSLPEVTEVVPDNLECHKCCRKFSNTRQLRKHICIIVLNIEEEGDPGKQFKCTVCDYTAAQKPQLLRHMEQHASFKPFRCAHCHYSCNISGSLKRHYNRKHPNEDYVNVGTGELAADALIQQGGLKCPVCSFVYGTKWEFNRHLKNKHRLKLMESDGDTKWELATEVSEESSTQYLHITEAEEDVQGTQAAVAALQDLRYTSENGERLDPTAVNILQQIIELGTETHDAAAVASVVAMAPGTVTVVKQVTEEEQSANHTVMIQETLQQASVELAEQHHLVVSSDDVEGIETVTVYTQGGEASEFIVYVQEALQPVEEQTVEHSAQDM